VVLKHPWPEWCGCLNRFRDSLCGSGKSGNTEEAKRLIPKIPNAESDYQRLGFGPLIVKAGIRLGRRSGAGRLEYIDTVNSEVWSAERLLRAAGRRKRCSKSYSNVRDCLVILHDKQALLDPFFQKSDEAALLDHLLGPQIDVREGLRGRVYVDRNCSSAERQQISDRPEPLKYFQAVWIVIFVDWH